MHKQTSTYKRFTTHVILMAIVACTIFGRGLHLHAIFDHFFNHGDIHAYVHAHPSNSDYDHYPEFDGEDAHQHPTATVDLTGTLTQKTKSNIANQTDIMSVSGVLSSLTVSQTSALFFSDLSPPDLLYLSNYYPSLSLRGPPLG